MKCAKRIVLFTLFAMKLVDQPAPEVKIEQGILSGKVSPDGSFFEYLGIPYATTNSSTRFKAPLPPPSWEGVFKATDETYQCPQTTLVGTLGTEDCLKINVYVPAKARKPRPVMVFIHGGTFVIGNGGKGLYGPEFLMRQDVILVTFNYRLGVLGFLCLGIKEAPGNAGLKDQIAALRWVQKNIAAFGGDPENVTIFGLSAGAVSVSILLASKSTDGLFNKAIIQSGVSTASWAINRQPLFTATLIAKELGYNTTDPKEIYDLFSKIDYKNLIAATPIKPEGKYFDFQLLNYPCVENVIEGEEAVITDLPYNLLEKFNMNVSIMFGTTSKEGLMLLAYDTEESLKERDDKYIFAPDLEFKSEEEAEYYSNVVKKVYFGEEKISFKVRDMIHQLYTHMYFEMPNLLETELVLNTTPASVYNYYFNYSGGRNFLKYINGYRNESGACHADELMYVFKGLAWPFPISKRDQVMVDRMTEMFANFAKYGDPTPSTSELPIKWEPSTKQEIKLLYIDEELKMGPIPNPKYYRLWKDIYSKYRKRDKVNDFKT
ncbi:juvenile hormone esterase-like [Anticarsia gemmatalis]|uniref:juvenile hormone esterase-like n=1 Tax=Anticarsia gemmatalis TaxID=129554 RepID=UPI003F765A2E